MNKGLIMITYITKNRTMPIPPEDEKGLVILIDEENLQNQLNGIG